MVYNLSDSMGNIVNQAWASKQKKILIDYLGGT